MHQRNGIRAPVEGDARGMIVGQYVKCSKDRFAFLLIQLHGPKSV